jgi:hypothetical protein
MLNRVKSAKKNHHCPFMILFIIKSRLVDYPCVCSPYRYKEIRYASQFLEKGPSFDIAKAHFGSIHNILVFSGVGLPDGNRLCDGQTQASSVVKICSNRTPDRMTTSSKLVQVRT